MVGRLERLRETTVERDIESERSRDGGETQAKETERQTDRQTETERDTSKARHRERARHRVTETVVGMQTMAGSPPTPSEAVSKLDYSPSSIVDSLWLMVRDVPGTDSSRVLDTW